MSRNILILDGHPDPADDRSIQALAAACEGAQASNHTVHVIRLADLTFPLLRSKADYDRGEPVDSVRRCQDLMTWAEHVVILYEAKPATAPSISRGAGFPWFRGDATRIPRSHEAQ